MIQRRWRTTLSRHRLPLLVAAVCAAAFLATPALADRIPSSVKSSNSPSHAVVQAFIDGQVKDLSGDDPGKQKLARESLISECSAHSGTSASPEYGTEYATDLNKALLVVLKNAKSSIRSRLNSAVVASTVAGLIFHDGGSAAPLQPLVEACLKDKQVSIVIWGAKAAKYVIASEIQVGNNAGPLAAVLTQAVKDHADSGPVVEEAFNSLTLESGAFETLKSTPAFQQGITKVIPAILDLVAWRGAQYKSSGSVPSPLADRPVTVFLPVTAFSAVNADPATRNRTLKVMGETTCSTVQSLASGNSAPDLIEMVKADGNAFYAFGQQLSNPDVQKAGKAIQEMSQNTDPTKMTKLCEDLAAALKAVGVDIATGNGPGAGETSVAPALAGSTK